MFNMYSLVGGLLDCLYTYRSEKTGNSYPALVPLPNKKKEWEPLPHPKKKVEKNKTITEMNIKVETVI